MDERVKSVVEEYRLQMRRGAVWLYLGAVAGGILWLFLVKPTPETPYLTVVILSALGTAALARLLPWERWRPEAYLGVYLLASVQVALVVWMGVPAGDLFFLVALVAGLRFQGWYLAFAVAWLLFLNYLELSPLDFLLHGVVIVLIVFFAYYLLAAVRRLSHHLEVQVEERTAQLNFSYGLADLLSRPGDLPTLMTEALRRLVAELGRGKTGSDETGAAVFLLDKTEETVRLVAGWGLPAGLPEAKEEMAATGCPAGAAALSGEIVRVGAPRAGREGDHCGLCAKTLAAGWSLVTVPLVSDERREGSLLLQLPPAYPFAEEERLFLLSLGKSLGEAVHHARLRDELVALANHDALSGLLNHREFWSRLREEGERAARYKRPLCLLLLDIDHFKRINDTYGHSQGDLVIKFLGQLLQENCRASDVAARYGGEEFAVLLPELDQVGAAAVAERLRQALDRQAFLLKGNTVAVTVSIGVATLDGETGDAAGLLEAADGALYAAKAAGRNRVEVAKREPVEVAESR